LPTAAFISTIYTIIVFTFGAWLCQRYSENKKSGMQLHKIPVFWAAIAGLALSFFALPYLVRLPLDFVETTTPPLALLATGAAISVAGIKENAKAIGAISAIKLLVMPTMVVLIGAIAGISGSIYRTSLLEAAVPVGVTNTVLAQQFGLDDRLASSAVVVSTALFFGTIALILIFL
jgi:predicted permease